MEKTKKTRIIREQLQNALVLLQGLHVLKRPPKGWIRSIREALGMSGTQLAGRMGIKPPRISELEKAEASGNVTLKSLRRAAEALECDLVYGLVPKSDLDQTLRNRARMVAGRKLSHVSHSMMLEEQGVGKEKEDRMFEAMVDDLVRAMPRWLWNKP